MIYDAIILSHPKDYNKISFCLDSLRNLDPSPLHTYLVTPDAVSIDGLISISDKEAINVDIEQIHYKRPNWIYQQLIKLYQDFTANNIYMCIDSDVIFNRPIHFTGKTFFISDRAQHHEPYFNFMKSYFGITEWANHTFINDFMIFDKQLCRIMLPEINRFVEHLNTYLSDDRYLFSEFETYGNFVAHNFSGMYTFRLTKTKTLGKYTSWDTQELIIAKELCKTLPIDLFTVHTWT